jgi:hypothetical protein
MCAMLKCPRSERGRSLVGVIGLYGGVPGALAGGTYFVGEATGLNDAVIRARRPLVEAQLDVLTYGSPSDCMCFP